LHNDEVASGVDGQMLDGKGLGKRKGPANGRSSPPATNRRSSISARRISGRGRKAATTFTHERRGLTYDVTLPSQPRIRERVRWLAAEQLERVDGPDKSTTIFDRRTHEITLLTPANRTFRKLDMPRQPEEPAPEAILKRGNESIVAGLHCINWSWIEDVETRTVCITVDGVLLRFVVDAQTVTEARSVNYRRQPVELFKVPRGYTPALTSEGVPGF
jgi:hypothetical protein